MEKIDHLLHAKCITCEENNRVLENHALAIENKKILSILPSTKAKQKYQAGKKKIIMITRSCQDSLTVILTLL